MCVVFDETWNSSMMFSSTLTVVQSSGPSDDSLVLRPPTFSFAAWPCARCTLKHPLSDSFTPFCPSPPWTRAVHSDCVTLFHTANWDCRRVLHRTPPNELDQHGPSGHGWHSSHCTELCKCFNVVISQAMNVVVLPSTRQFRSSPGASLGAV